VTARTRSDRAREAGRIRARSPRAVGELTEEIARHLVGLPLDYGVTVDHIAVLLAADPRNTAHLAAVVRVIVDDAMSDPFRETHANRWRGKLPAWLRPPMVGATVRRLLAAGVLVGTGRYVRSTDTHGRNGGKLMPVYTLDLAAPALRDRSTAPTR
jgi:hypothetical protein